MSEGNNKPYKKPCDKSYEKSVYRSFVMIVQFGINMLVPICAMSALGIFLDKKLGTSYIMVILFFVGALAGAQNIYRMAKNIFESGDVDENIQNENTRNGNIQDKDIENDNVQIEHIQNENFQNKKTGYVNDSTMSDTESEADKIYR